MIRLILIFHTVIFLFCMDLGGVPSNRSIQTISSLLYYVNDLVESIESRPEACRPSTFDSYLKQIYLSPLWQESAQELEGTPFDIYLFSARHLFEEGIKSSVSGTTDDIRSFLRQSSLYLTTLWLTLNRINVSEIKKIIFTQFPLEKRSLDFVESLNQGELTQRPACGKSASYRREFAQNPYISPEIIRKIKPYLIPKSHPLINCLDDIFHTSRATQDKEHLKIAGFKSLYQRPRSYIRVLRHNKLPNHLLKVYTDDEVREKKHQPGWFWFVRRCKGARRIQEVIHNNNIQHFQVPQKWIYPLPPEPSPPLSSAYTRQLFVLLVEDMDLTNRRDNLKAWRNLITKQHLNELYIIISRAHGSSYRPDNIPYSKNGKFSFIDTEYPHRLPDYKSIRRYLSIEMLTYWNNLIQNGGP